MSTPFLGQLMLVPFGFAPKGFALCNGQLLQINQNQALFSLLGTTYGGNGIQTFGLPNLQSQTAISFSGNYPLGSSGGAENVALTITELPSHTHTLSVSNASGGNLSSPNGNTVGVTAGSAYAGSFSDVMASASITSAGSSVPHENRSPFLVLNWVIALTGIFPSRN